MFPTAVCPLTPYAMSSIKPSARSGALGISSSSALYITKRIGDSGDPCGIPAVMLMLEEVVPLKRSCVVLDLKCSWNGCVMQRDCGYDYYCVC